MKASCAGGHAQGTLIGFPFDPFTAPSQSPVPVGFTPEWKPSGGASAAICAADGVPAAGFDAGGGGGGAAATVALGGGGAAAALVVAAGLLGWGATTALGSWPASIAFCCSGNVVETTGQPLPGPLRFCSVTAAAFRRAFCAPLELSVGKERRTLGLVRTWPAATLAFSFCGSAKRGETMM